MESDIIITPAGDVSTIDTDTSSLSTFDKLDNYLDVLTDLVTRLKAIIQNTEARNIANGLTRIASLSHSLVLGGTRDLNLISADLHIIHTAVDSHGVINVYPGPIENQIIGRKNCTIVNKGMGLLILQIYNTIGENTLVRNITLHPYQKQDLSIIHDGNDIILC